MRAIYRIAAAAVLAMTGLASAKAQTAPPIYTNETGQPQAAIGTFCPDPARCGSGGGGSVPTGTAGTPNSSVVTVQGITGGTPQPISAAALPLPAGAATAANQATMAANQTATGTGAQTVQGNVANATADAGNPVKVGGIYSSTTLSALAIGQRGDMQLDGYGNVRARLVGGTGAAPVDTGSTSAGLALVTGNLSAGATPLNTLGYVWNGTNIITQRGDATGIWLGGHGTIATGQVSVGTTATLIIAAQTGRQSVGVTVTTAVQCAFGPAGVTLATGWPLAATAYASDRWDTAAALYGVCASTATVAYRTFNP